MCETAAATAARAPGVPILAMPPPVPCPTGALRPLRFHGWRILIKFILRPEPLLMVRVAYSAVGSQALPKDIPGYRHRRFNPCPLQGRKTTTRDEVSTCSQTDLVPLLPILMRQFAVHRLTCREPRYPLSSSGTTCLEPRLIRFWLKRASWGAPLGFALVRFPIIHPSSHSKQVPGSSRCSR